MNNIITRDSDKDIVVIIDTESGCHSLAEESDTLRNGYDIFFTWDPATGETKLQNESDMSEFTRTLMENKFIEQVHRLKEKGKVVDMQDLREWESERKAYEQESAERERDGDSYDPFPE